MNNDNSGGSGHFQNPGQMVFILICAAVISFFLYSMVRSIFSDGMSVEISYTDFMKMVEDDEVDRVQWGDSSITVFPKEGTKAPDSLEGYDTYHRYLNANGLEVYTVVPVPADAEHLVQLMYEHGVNISKNKPSNSGYIFEILLSIVLPFALLFFFMTTMNRRGGGGVMGVGKSTAKMYMQKTTGVTFRDVAGEDEAKESLVEIVDFLHNPGKYSAIGAKLPKGALLVGPPGTGKTLLAKAVAGEAGVPFYSLSGSDFVEMFVGVGASRVRDLFRQASQNAPCIIFIDEIDAIGKTRDTRYGGNDEREQTLNQLLSEMDGFDPEKGIMVMGATNRPEILDPALLRPGRFDRRIIVEKPDLKGRVEILKVHAKGKQLDSSVNFNEIALATSGAVGADLANMMNEAAITAVKHKRQRITQADLFEAVELVLVGKEKKDRILSPKERKIVSYHEVGHALVSAIEKNSEPVQKITIVPRTMGALGYVMQVPEEEKYLNSKDELHTMLVTYLAGRAAEEIVFGTITTGAANDIEKATGLARDMVTQYGMSEKIGLMGLATKQDVYLTNKTVMNCSEETAAEVDQEVMKILRDSYEEAKKILRENRYALDRIAGFLIEEETITGRQFMKILRAVQEEVKSGRVRGDEPAGPDNCLSSEEATKLNEELRESGDFSPMTDHQKDDSVRQRAAELHEEVRKAQEEVQENHKSFEEARAEYTRFKDLDAGNKGASGTEMPAGDKEDSSDGTTTS